MNPAELSARKEIFRKISSYYKKFHAKPPFRPGESSVNYGGRVYDEKELINITDAALDFWLTSGRYCAEFEKRLGRFLGVEHVSLVNSGSSANLVAFMALTSPTLGARRVKPGDEVVTVAAGFPTTVTPVIQYGAVPVFVDIELPYYNIDCSLLEKAVSKKTRAVMLAHTLGNPFDIAKVKKFCDKHDLWLIEDNCDALGSRSPASEGWKRLQASTPPRLQYTGSFGDIGTSSFYPAHHITLGEGGAVYTNNRQLKFIMDSFRDWGRDCSCPPGQDNTCRSRFTRQFGELPLGYDHKYVYSHFGFNLKATEMQAAIGLAQLEKLPAFITARKKNWAFLRAALKPFRGALALPEPTPGADPSWFGFPITVKEKAGFTRDEIVSYLEKHRIQTRTLFAGNLIKHPCFDEMRRSGKGFRVVSGSRKPSNHPTLQPSSLPVTDLVMSNTFWIGVYPGINKKIVDYISSVFTGFMHGR